MASLPNKSALGGILFEMKSWLRFLLPTKYVAVYYPTPDVVIERMLQLAEVTPRDVVYDLGCGDGRVLMAAARRGARAVGVELDRELVQAALSNVRASQLEHLVRVVQGDAAATDLSDASVVALYLSERGNTALMRAVQRTLRPGSRVVSFYFPIEGWQRHLLSTDVQDNLAVHVYSAPPPDGGDDGGGGGSKGA